MIMEPGEILREYNASKYKSKQLTILADLNLCTKEEIQQVLEQQGVVFRRSGSNKKNQTPEKKEENTRMKKSVNEIPESVRKLVETEIHLKEKEIELQEKEVNRKKEILKDQINLIYTDLEIY